MRRRVQTSDFFKHYNCIINDQLLVKISKMMVNPDFLHQNHKICKFTTILSLNNLSRRLINEKQTPVQAVWASKLMFSRCIPADEWWRIVLNYFDSKQCEFVHFMVLVCKLKFFIVSFVCYTAALNNFSVVFKINN